MQLKFRVGFLKGFNPYEWLVTGITLYGLAYCLEHVYDNKIFRVLLFFAWFFILTGFTKVEKRKPKGFFNYLLSLYWFFLTIIFIRGYFLDDIHYWKSPIKFFYDHFVDPRFVLSYFLPILSYVKIEKTNLSFLVKLSFVVCFIFLIVFVSSLHRIRDITESLYLGLEMNNWETPAGGVANVCMNVVFCLFLTKYLSKYKSVFIYICCLLAIYAVALGARRGAIAILSLYLFISLFIYFKDKNKVFLLVLPLLIVILLHRDFDYSSFNYLIERGLDDTRSGVDNALLRSLDSFEFFCGKGLLGRYYYPLYNTQGDGWRYLSETGFYTMVLRGGYLFAILYVLILLYPAYLGMFHSNNKFTKYCSVYILINVLELYPSLNPCVDLKHVFLWFSVLCCLSRKYRKLPEKEMVSRLNKLA